MKSFSWIFTFERNEVPSPLPLISPSIRAIMGSHSKVGSSSVRQQRLLCWIVLSCFLVETTTSFFFFKVCTFVWRIMVFVECGCIVVGWIEGSGWVHSTSSTIITTMNKICARPECGKTVYPLEELKCLDKVGYLYVPVYFNNFRLHFLRCIFNTFVIVQSNITKQIRFFVFGIVSA